MLDAVIAYLTCPLCGGELARSAGAVRCERGHAFDVARQGYVNLLSGGPPPGTADTAAMVAARAAFLAAGHYAPLARRLAQLAAETTRDGLVIDAGGGTGAFIRPVLDAIPNASGLVIDVSKHALRRAARVSPRAGAIAWDVWRPLPVRSGAAALVLDVLAPRNAGEFRRILRDDGALLVATPTPRHLAELVEALGMINVDPRKEERLESSLSPYFHADLREELDVDLELSAAEAAAAALMGPSARHSDAGEVERRAAALGARVLATASFVVSRYRPIT